MCIYQLGKGAARNIKKRTTTNRKKDKSALGQNLIKFHAVSDGYTAPMTVNFNMM
jgi:hypothetical protein